MPMNRRQFVARASYAAATVSLPWLIPARAFGANDTVRVGVVGMGIRGSLAHLPGMANQKNVTIAAVCDPDATRLAEAVKLCETKHHCTPALYADMRAVFARKDIDVACIATQQYWHALATIWACQAGKHVYVEKPLAHYIWEGRQMVHAARKYNRLVQCGTQQRSNTGTQAAIAWIRAGNLGKIQKITAFANKPRVSVGKRAAPLEIPAAVNYDLWCGPAQKLPLYRDKLQYDCSFDWNTGDGESANQGVHEIDVARWLLGETGLPRRVMSIGGRFVFNDAADCPNTQIIYYDFPSAPVLYEVHNLRAAKGSNQAPTFRGRRTGIAVDCEGGYVFIYQGGKAFDKNGKLLKTFLNGGDHFVNFIEAVRAGDRQKLNADVLEGHISTAVCHAGNISYRLGKPAATADMRRQIGDVPPFAEMFDRYLEHLKAHEIDPNQSTLGPWLECDREQECFRDHDEANALVKGCYRAPYLVPDVAANVVAAMGAAAVAPHGTATGPVRVAHVDDKRRFAEAKAAVEADNPGLKLGLVDVDGEQVLRAEHGGMRVFWLHRGQGEVYIPKGFRTQEGDGAPLPAEYVPDNIAPEFAAQLQFLREHKKSASRAAQVPLEAILGRWRRAAYVGDFAGEIWRLEHTPRPWSDDAQVVAALEKLFHSYRAPGHSTKQVGSFEPIVPGDQLIACAQDEIRVRGRFQCLTMENVNRPTSHVAAVRRLRYLQDTAGGCNPDFDPFRRLPLTWFPNYPGESGDGLNWVNSHVVNIPKETSPTHFHPPTSAAGIAQREMYLVLDPQAYKLNTWGRKASIILFPNLHDLARFEQHALEPGMFLYIPPGAGHRGLDAFVNVLTIPGFKMHNEFYIDRDVRDLAGGKAPYNKNLVDSKNYARLEDFFP